MSATLLSLVVFAHYWTRISKTVLFWAAFVLTRPLGAVVGDLLDKPTSMDLQQIPLSWQPLSGGRQNR